MLAQREKKEEKEKEKTKGNKNTRLSLLLRWRKRDEKNGWVNEKHGKSRDARRMSKCTVY